MTRTGQYISPSRRNTVAVPVPAPARGDQVKAAGGTWLEVVRVNRKSVSVAGGAPPVPLADIVDTRTPSRPAKPLAVQIARSASERLRAFAERARDQGGIAGLRYGSEVIDLGLRRLLEQLRDELAVGTEWPAPPRTRAPRRDYGGVLSTDTELAQITVKLDPELLAQTRAALWFFHTNALAPAVTHGVASLQEMVTLAVTRVLDDLERGSAP